MTKVLHLLQVHSVVNLFVQCYWRVQLLHVQGSPSMVSYWHHKRLTFCKICIWCVWGNVCHVCWCLHLFPRCSLRFSYVFFSCQARRSACFTLFVHWLNCHRISWWSVCTYTYIYWSCPKLIALMYSVWASFILHWFTFFSLWVNITLCSYTPVLETCAVRHFCLYPSIKLGRAGSSDVCSLVLVQLIADSWHTKHSYVISICGRLGELKLQQVLVAPQPQPSQRESWVNIRSWW